MAITWKELEVLYKEVIDLCEQTDKAAQEILKHSNLWLWLHPFQRSRMRKDMMVKRAKMFEARDKYIYLVRRFKTQ